MYDDLLERMWEALGDVATDEDGIYLDEDFIYCGIPVFPKGTGKEDVWHWFDKLHSTGVYVLMGLDKERGDV